MTKNGPKLIAAVPAAYGLTAADAMAYGTEHTAYSTALTACDKAVRNKPAVNGKYDVARRAIGSRTSLSRCFNCLTPRESRRRGQWTCANVGGQDGSR